MKEVSKLDYRIKYCGYDGYALDGFNYKKLARIPLFVKTYMNNGYLKSCTFDNVEKLNLDEIKAVAKDILSKFFDITNIDYLSTQELQKLSGLDFICDDSSIVYNKINGLLVSKSPFDLDINIVPGHSMTGLISKPLVLAGTMDSDREILEFADNRKVYFSSIELGDELNKVSVGTYAHEIAHSQQERHIGYTKDFLNKEIISIFIEKLVADELDSTGRLLKLVEKGRFIDFYNHYYKYQFKIQNDEEKVNDLLYMKSYLVANKLFDMYKNERKQKNRDKYIDDIQKVFDGKITVEDLIDSRHISISQCQDFMLLKRRS